MDPAEAPICLVLTGQASQARQRYGPTAWTLLEELLQRGELDGEAVVITVSLRQLARWVGVSKDTVSRAAHRLRRHGVVTIDSTSREVGSSSRYVVHLPSLPVHLMTVHALQRRAS